MKIDMMTEHYTADGHLGTWYVVEEFEYRSHKFYLMEHEEYGDEVACIAVDKNGVLVAEDLWNGFDDDFKDAADEFLNAREV